MPSPPRAASSSSGAKSSAAAPGIAQMTFARIRSLLVQRADQRPDGIDDEHAGDAVVLHHLGRLDRQRVGADGAGRGA